MAFRCQKCGEAQRDWATPTLFVVERRDKTYPVRKNAEGDIIDKGGVGYETVREIQVCGKCIQ